MWLLLENDVREFRSMNTARYARMKCDANAIWRTAAEFTVQEMFC